MPGFNGTGPQGAGSMTGRGLGPCGGGMAYGRRLGRGFGRGLSRGYGYRQLSKSEEAADTKAYIQDLEAELKDTQEYLKSLGDKK